MSLILSHGFFQKSLARLKGFFLIEPQGVGQPQLLFPLRLGQITAQPLTQPVCWQTQNLLHLFQRPPLSAVGRHAQGVSGGKRRKQNILSLFPCLVRLLQ